MGRQKTAEAKAAPYRPPKDSWKKDFRKNKAVYLLFLPVFIYFLVMNYLPMFGITMAFQDFNILDGYFGSKFIGFENFKTLFTGGEFLNAFKNTVAMAGLNMTIAFITPVFWALLITSLRSKKYAKICKVVSYLPNFVSATVVANLVIEFLDRDGAITLMLHSVFGLDIQNWLANSTPPVFWLINCLMGVWQGFGYGSIFYVAAISNLNNDLYEAAAIDGAGAWARVWKITMPNIMPMVLTMFIVQIGVCLMVGFDKILLIYMPKTYNVSDCLYTYTYRMAFGSQPDYGLGSASGLFQSVLGMFLLTVSNLASRKFGNTRLF